MTLSTAEENILFGILGLKTGAIDIFQLHQAFQKWTLDKSRPLSQLLVDDGAISNEQRSEIQAMVGLPENQATLDLPETMQRSVSDSLQAFVDDSDFQMFVVNHEIQVRTTPPASKVSGATGSPATGRFRIIRPHAKGGIGEVFVAHDEELDRQVALKQIQRTSFRKPLNIRGDSFEKPRLQENLNIQASSPFTDLAVTKMDIPITSCDSLRVKA